MSELTPLQLSMHADKALEREDADAVEAQLANSEADQARFDVYQSEARALSASMQMETNLELSIPKFKRPLTLRGFAMANIATGLVLWLAQFLWKTLFGEFLMDMTARISSVYLPDTYELFANSILYFLEEGTAMFDAYLGLVVLIFVIVAGLFGVGVLFKYRRSHTASLGAMLLLATSANLLTPQPAHALELRSDEEGMLIVEATETIDDTLLIAASTVRIEGHVTGTVVAAAQSIEVLGRIDGNLIAAAQNISLSGSVGQLLIGTSSSLDVEGAQIGGDIIYAGERLAIDDESKVEGNGVIAGARMAMDGELAKDLYVFTELAEIRGTVGRSLEAFANRIWLKDNAHIKGDLRWRSDNPQSLEQDDSARVDGEITQLELPDELKNQSPFTSIEFYLWQLAQFVSAVLVGLVLLWMFPGVRDMSIGSGGEALKSVGIGLVLILSLPMIALILAITIIGLPFGIVTFFAWIAGIYVAKVAIGLIVGYMMIPDSDSRVLPIVAGMAALIVAINVPWIGGVISFLVTVLGLGILAMAVLDHFSNRQAA